MSSQMALRGRRWRRYRYMKKVGIIGGLGPQATELFYHELIRLAQESELMKYPHLLINSIDVFSFTKILHNKEQVINLMEEEISKIENFVDFIVFPCNTVHFIIDEMRTFSQVPILAIHEEVVREITKTNVKKIGIIGTQTTLASKFYQNELQKNNIHYESLDSNIEQKIDSVIMNKMLRGKNFDELHDLLLDAINILKNKGCDGVILACTELPLFVKQEEVSIPLFLSTQILAQATFKKILEKDT